MSKPISTDSSSIGGGDGSGDNNDNSGSSSSHVLSSEKIQRGKEFVYQLADLHAKVGRKNSIPANVYPVCKGMANWFESVARDSETKPSQIERIDLRTGKVFRRRGRAVETTNRRGEGVRTTDSRRRARAGKQTRSSRR